MDPANNPPDPSWARFAAELMWVVLAMAGGVARYLDIYLRTGVLPKFGFLFAHAVVSGFSGYMVAQIIMRVSPDWALVAAGVGGYLGTQGLDWVATVLKARFERQIAETDLTPPQQQQKPHNKIRRSGEDPSQGGSADE